MMIMIMNDGWLMIVSIQLADGWPKGSNIKEKEKFGGGPKTYVTSKYRNKRIGCRRVRLCIVHLSFLLFFSTSMTSLQLLVRPNFEVQRAFRQQICELIRRYLFMGQQKAKTQAETHDRIEKYLTMSTWRPSTKSLCSLIYTLSYVIVNYF